VFDIGFSELILVFIVGLVVLGPQRLPVAVKTVVGWIRALRSLAANVQNELAQELKLQELQDSLKKVEEASKNSLSPELKASMEELKQSAESMKRTYLGENEKADDEANTIHNPLVKNAADSHEGVTPAAADHQASAPMQAPENSATEPAEPVMQQEQQAPVVHVSPAASEPTVVQPAKAQAAGAVSPAASEPAAVQPVKVQATGAVSPAASEPVAVQSEGIRAAEAPAAASAPYENNAGTPAAAQGYASATVAEKAKAAVKDEAPALSSRAPVSPSQPDER